jgi:hypothetical protein
MDFPALTGKTIVITMVDSPGGQFIGVLLAKKFREMGVDVLLVVNTDLSSQVKLYGLEGCTVMAGELKSFTSGHQVFKLGLQPMKLVKASLEILAHNVPPLMTALYDWFCTSGMKAEDVIFLGNSLAIGYFSPMLLEMGITDLNVIDPYLFLNYKGGWSGGDNGQLLGSDLLAPWLFRFLYVKAGREFGGKIIGRRIGKRYGHILRHLRNQIQIISPQLLKHVSKPGKRYYVVGYPIHFCKTTQFLNQSDSF